VTAGQYLDTLGLWEAVAGAPEQLLASLAEAEQTGCALAVPSHPLQQVIVCGVGSSGTVGRAVAAYADLHGRVPVSAVTGPQLPTFVGPSSVVVAVSQGGTEEETLEATETASARGAAVVVVTPDGALSDLADSFGLPRLRLPGGAPGRTAVGSAVAVVLVALAALDLVDDAAPSLRAAAGSLQRRRDLWLGAASPAADLARRIGRTIPLVYGAAGLPAVAARHWKTQCNENVKTPAFWGVLPDAAHDEVSGWGQHGDITRQVLTLIALRHRGEHPLVARRFELVLEAMDEVMADVLLVWAEGDDDLGCFLDLALLGDFVSLYLAGREGIDPGPVAAEPPGG
jgi:glucose/mannose-6-phosphate isomerase